MRESRPAATASSPAIDDKRAYRSSLGVHWVLSVVVVWSRGAAALVKALPDDVLLIERRSG
jgi:hypothetical protein